MVYRGMDIGTAKPDAATLALAPHRLIDIRDPEDSYSAGDFVRDAQREIESIRRNNRIPLLVGGTMMYFRSLTQGIAELPAADPELRAAIDAEAEALGWPALHAQLEGIDPQAAAKIEPNDSQRIQRALEVYRASGRNLTDWQNGSAGAPPRPGDYAKIGLVPADRPRLHRHIEKRLAAMLEAGFVEEVRDLMQRPQLSLQSPSMRSVGYRQYWSALETGGDLLEAGRRALYATRQLAKRQYTWLRAERELHAFDPLEEATFAAISTHLSRQITE